MTAAPIKLGIAGLGRAFSLMLPTFLNDPRIRITAGCDPREQARRQFAADFSAPAFSEVRELAQSGDVDVVYIASPHQFHAEHVRVVASEGKHILLEKPMAISMAECDEIIEACEKYGVRIIVGHCHSFDQPYLETRKIIDSGKFGRVRQLSAWNFTDFLYRPRRPEELDTSQGGGVVFSQGAHQIDILRMLAGSDVVNLRAVMGKWDPSRPTEGVYSALFWFEDGAFASATYSGYAHFDSDLWMDGRGEMGQRKDFSQYALARTKLQQISPEVEAQLKTKATYGGSDFKLEKPPFERSHQHFGPMLVSCEHADLRPLPDRVEIYADFQKEALELARPAFPRKEVIDELEQAVVHGHKTLHDGYWARKTLQVCLAMLESARTGKDVAIPS